MARFNINTWNAKVDRTKTVIWEGKNGIIYEYVLPYGANPLNFHQEAEDVRSHKKATSKWPNGKKPGEYQPVGDKRYFTFYQMRKMSKKPDWEKFLDDVERRQQDTLAYLIKSVIIDLFTGGK